MVLAEVPVEKAVNVLTITLAEEAAANVHNIAPAEKDTTRPWRRLPPGSPLRLLKRQPIR